jgi:hypothetical protein
LGGTEVYVRGLAAELGEIGLEQVWFAGVQANGGDS